MKKEDIEKAQEGELEKVTGFQYDRRSISRIDPPSLQEEHWEKRQESADRIKAGECLRCGEPLEEAAEKCLKCGKLKKLIT